MHKGVDGACGKDPVGELREELRNKHGLLRKHGRGYKAHLGAKACPVQDGDACDLASCAAGGGQDHKLAVRGEISHVRVEVVHPLARACHCQNLGNIYDCASAHGKEPAAGQVFHGFENGVYHHVRGFAAAVLFLVDAAGWQIHVPEEGLIDVFVGQDDVLWAWFEDIGKLPAGGKGMDFRFALYLNHWIFLVLQVDFRPFPYRSPSRPRRRAPFS